jgi:hypothetical protein
MMANNNYGALVGWTSQDLGNRLLLRLESVTTAAPHTAGDVNSFYFVMDKNQAVQLGNNLFELAGQMAPRKHKRSWLDRVVGGKPQESENRLAAFSPPPSWRFAETSLTLRLARRGRAWAKPSRTDEFSIFITKSLTLGSLSA